MKSKDEQKKERILKLLSDEKERWLTTNEISTRLALHHYKTETLLYQLLGDSKIILDKSRGSFTFWKIR